MKPRTEYDSDEVRQQSISFLSLAILIVAMWMLAPHAARGDILGLYFSGELGANFASSMDTDGEDTDRASACDEYINPLYATDPACTAPRRPGESAWINAFGSGSGFLAGGAVGARLPARVRVELEYFYRDSGYDETAPVASGGGSVLAKIGGELEVAEESIGSIVSHNLFGNLYYDFKSQGRFTPYIGIGAGFGFTEIDYGGVFARNLDPSAITSVGDLANADQVRSTLAGTTTTEREVLRDALFGYQLLVGVDYALSEKLSLGVKGRWVDFNSFSDDRNEWDRLRSHPSNLRLDGGEPVTYGIKTDDIRMIGVSLNLKYQF